MAQENRRVTIYINGQQVENSLKGISAEMAKTRAQLRKLTIGTDEYNRKAAELRQLEGYYRRQTNALRGMGTQGGFASQAMSGLKSTFGSLISPVGLVTAGIGAAFAAIASGVGVIRETEVAMDDLQAITGLTTEEMSFFRQEAVNFAKQFGETPKAILEAFKLAGSARPELLQSKEALASFTEQAIILAKASKSEVTDSISALTTIMNANGAASEEASRYINVLAAGSQKGAKEVEYLAKAFEKVGPVAATAGLSIEQQTAFLELLGEKGFNSAETAGTSFRNILLTLQTDAENLTNGQLDLNKVYENYGPLANNATELTKIFGKENVAQAQAVLLNKERFEQLNAAVTGTNTAQEQAAIQMDNMDGKLGVLSAKWDSLWASMEDGDSIISSVLEAASWALDQISASMEKVKAATKLVKSIFGADKMDKAENNMVSQINQEIEARRESNRVFAERLKEEGKLSAYVAQRQAALSAEQEGSAKYLAIQDEIVVLKQVLNSETEKQIAAEAKAREEAEKQAEAQKEAAKAKKDAEKAMLANEQKKRDDRNAQDVANGVVKMTPKDYSGELKLEMDHNATLAQMKIDSEIATQERIQQIDQQVRDDEFAKWEKYYQDMEDTKKQLTALGLETLGQLASIAIDNRTKKERAALDSQKKADLISQEQYDAKIELLQRQAFERKKRLDIAMALMNGAVAATKANAEFGGPPWSIPALIAIGAETAAQVALLAAQTYGEGGLVTGPSHANGGVPAIMEGNEYVIRKKYVTPESLPLLEAINTGKIRYMDTRSAQQNTRADKEGKLVQMASSSTSVSGNYATKEDLIATINAMEKWQREFNVSLPLRDLDKANTRKSRIEKLANVA